MNLVTNWCSKASGSVHLQESLDRVNGY